MTTTYECSGSVRGSCGHAHRTLSGAVACRSRDHRGCARQGGYSDRRVVRTDGETMTEAEIDMLESCEDRMAGR
jgi:hypothetical protein